MFKVGDEVVNLTITGSGYCKVLEVEGDKIKTDLFSDILDVEPRWEPITLYRYATDSDREWLRQFYEARDKMLEIKIYIKDELIDEISLVNTGHVKDGKNLYRFRKPVGKNHLEIYHDKNEPWQVLVEKSLHELNESNLK